MRSWKTTLGGVLAIVGIVFKGITHGVNSLTADDYAIVAAAIGLMFSKDYNVSGLLKR